jgi:hypothetical protein
MTIDGFHTSFSVSPDGGSFVFFAPRRASDASRVIRIVWVDHWFADLKARLAE